MAIYDSLLQCCVLKICITRWKRALEAIEDALGEEMGKLYTSKYFLPEAKQVQIFREIVT
jgi:predicted metalloendopeptidase